MVRSLLLGIIFALLTATPAHSTDFTAATVKAEITAAWRSAHERIVVFRSTQTQASYRGAKDQTPVLWREDVLRYAVSGGNALFSYDITAVDPMTGDRRREDAQLVLQNSKYNATLNKATTRDEWLLTKYEQVDNPPGADRRTAALPWTLMANAIMWEWLNDPRVTVSRVERPSGFEAVRVHFTFDDESSLPGPRQKETNLRSGYIDFDPSRCFCILGYRLTRRSPAGEWVESGFYEYGGVAESLPVLQKVTVESPEVKTLRAGVLHTRSVSTYEIEYNTSIPEEIFWLSHYRLPEPVGVTPPPTRTPRHLWFVGGAVVFAGLAVGFWWLAARRSRRRDRPDNPR